MYEPEYLNVKQMCQVLGLGRNTVLRLCQEHTHGLPAVKIGNKWQADAELLEQWRRDWYSGKFDINQ